MIKEINFSKNRLTYGNVSKIFPDEILKVLEVQSGIVVLFNYQRLTRQNVYLLDKNLNEVWQIEILNEKMDFCPYTGMSLVGEKLKAYNGIGFDCEIDLETGKVLRADFVK